MSSVPKIERERNGRISCIVEFPADRAGVARERALEKLAKEVRLPGFRPGKAPREMILAKIKREDLLEETIQSLLPETLRSLVAEHKIQPILSPKVSLKKEDPLTVSIVFVERPTVTLKGVEKIAIEKKAHNVEEKDVDRMSAYILQKHETTAEVERPAAVSDRVTMDFWGTDAEGREIAPIRSQGHAVVLGSKSLIPGFEEALVGLKKGDAKSFTITFPKDYHAKELSEKPVTFHATVTKVEEVKRPELTDSFARENLGSESAAHFRRQIQISMVEQEERIERTRCERALMDAIRKATHVDLAPELVEEEERSLLQDLQEQLQRQGKTFDDWMKETGKKIEDVKKELEENAKSRITLRLGIRELMDAKKIEISDEEMHAAIAELLSPLSEKERKDAESAYQKGEHAWDQLKWQKKVEKLFSTMLQ